MIQHFPDGTWQEDGWVYSYDNLDDARESCHHLMVPEEPVKSVLILGVCKNNVGDLIKEEYPDCRLTLVDKAPLDKNTIEADAFSYLQWADPIFDFAVVDLCEKGSFSPLIYESEFYLELARVAPKASVNCSALDPLEVLNFEPYFRLVKNTYFGSNQVLILERC